MSERSRREEGGEGTGGPDERGALLVETLVAIALLGTIAASAQVLHLAAVDARLRSIDRLATVWEARSTLEALQSSVVPVSDGVPRDWTTVIGPAGLLLDLDVIPVEGASGPAAPSGRCGGQDPTHEVAAVSSRSSREAEGPTLATMRAVLPAAMRGSVIVTDGRSGAASLSVELVASPGATGFSGAAMAGLQVLVTPPEVPSDEEVDVGGDPPVVVDVGPDGCARAVGLGAGIHLVRVLLEDGIDRLHRTLDETEVRIATIDHTRLVVRADRAATLITTIVAEPDARLPDATQSDDGALGWVVMGDGVSLPAASGEQRRLHPGRVGIVVGVCASSLEHATSVIQELAAGAVQALEVSLPTVVLPSLTVPPGGGRLVAQRDADCPGAGGVRPELTWTELNITGTTVTREPRVALPNGRWQVRFESVDSAVLDGPFSIEVTEPGRSGT